VEQFRESRDVLKPHFYSLPADPRLMPTLSNGHVGFTTFSDSVYTNALYSGRGGLSHRARIPNFANLQFDDCARCSYTMNMQYGYFKEEMNVENEFIATHLVYAHRYYDRAIINQFFIQRLGSRGERLSQIACVLYLGSLMKVHIIPGDILIPWLRCL
jgi:hypothetical protein